MIDSSFLATLIGTLVIAAPIAAPTAPPAANFFDKSWDQMNKTPKYKVECTVTPGAINAASGLSADQQKIAELLTAALPRLSQKETDTVMGKEKRASAARVKSPSFQPYDSYLNGKLTYDQAKTYTEQTPQFSIQFVVGTQGLYYRGAAADPWKVIKSKELATAVLKSLLGSAITAGLDKSSMSFDYWQSDNVAVYKGTMTQELAQSLVSDAVGSSFTAKEIPTEVKIFVDKATKNWSRLDSAFTVDNGVVNFALARSCRFDYGKDANVALPPKATAIDVQTGANEFIGLTNNVK